MLQTCRGQPCRDGGVFLGGHMNQRSSTNSQLKTKIKEARYLIIKRKGVIVRQHTVLQASLYLPIVARFFLSLLMEESEEPACVFMSKNYAEHQWLSFQRLLPKIFR